MPAQYLSSWYILNGDLQDLGNPQERGENRSLKKCGNWFSQDFRFRETQLGIFVTENIQDWLVPVTL